jgi:hypothetical protein
VMLRIAHAEAPAVRALRRPVEDVLTFTTRA